MRVFISAATQDIDAAHAFAAALDNWGIPVTMPQSPETQSTLPQAVARQIDTCDTLLFLLSAASANDVHFVRQVQYADSQQKDIVVARLDRISLPKGLFFLNYQDAIDTVYWVEQGALRDATLKKLSRILGTSANPLSTMTMLKTQSESSKAGHASSQPRIIIVSQHGRGDFSTISDAIDAAPKGSKLLIHPGTYREKIRITKPLELVGDGARDQIILENAEGTTVGMATPYAALSGVTIRQFSRPKDANKGVAVLTLGGRLLIEDCDIHSDSNPCLSVRGRNADPFVKNCHIHGGSLGAVTILESASGTFEECDIHDNRYAGVIVSSVGNPLFRWTQIHHNADVGILVVTEGMATLEGCTIYNNGGHGASIEEGGSATLQRCVLQENGDSGINAQNQANATLKRCKVVQNKSKATITDATSHINVIS